jgi:hypothetical protein
MSPFLSFCRFTKEDVQSMDFGAYLASSSSEGSDDEGEEPSRRGQETAAGYGDDKITKYKVPSHSWCEVFEAIAVFVLHIGIAGGIPRGQRSEWW